MQNIDIINQVIDDLYKKYYFLENDKDKFKAILNLKEDKDKTSNYYKNEGKKKIYIYAEKQFSMGKFKDVVDNFIKTNKIKTIFDFIIIGSLCDKIKYQPTFEEIEFLCNSIESILKPLVELNLDKIKNGNYNFVKNNNFLVLIIKTYCLTNNIVNNDIKTNENIMNRDAEYYLNETIKMYSQTIDKNPLLKKEEERL